VFSICRAGVEHGGVVFSMRQQHDCAAEGALWGCCCPAAACPHKQAQHRQVKQGKVTSQTQREKRGIYVYIKREKKERERESAASPAKRGSGSKTPGGIRACASLLAHQSHEAQPCRHEDHLRW